MIKLNKNQMTGRSVLYIGFKCNLRCKFCYFAHEEAKTWEPIEVCKNAASILRSKYKMQAVDITGGEPSIYPHIHELLEHCDKIGLSPTLITNAQILADEKHVQKFKDSKVTDFLVSVHGYGETYDQITGSRGGFERLIRAIDNINKLSIPFRVNTTITTSSYKELKKIAELTYSKGSKVINYISFNPHYDWESIKDQDFQIKHSDILPHLKEALDYCDSVGLEANVRYFPFCMMKEHFNKCYNFSQLPYDPGEWDFQSWYSKDLYYPSAKIPDEFYNGKKENLYYIVARQQTNSIYACSSKCNNCALRNICDGLTKQYMERFGDSELEPKEGEVITKPNHFLQQKEKVLQTWANVENHEIEKVGERQIKKSNTILV